MKEEKQKKEKITYVDDGRPKAKKAQTPATAPDMDGAPAAKITAKEVVELMQSMETNKVYIETIRDLYKVRDLEELTFKQFDNISMNWGKIIERQNKVAQGN